MEDHRNDPDIMCQFGQHYMSLHTPEGDAEGIKWFKKAADLGHPIGMDLYASAKFLEASKFIKKFDMEHAVAPLEEALQMSEQSLSKLLALCTDYPEALSRYRGAVSMFFSIRYQLMLAYYFTDRKKDLLQLVPPEKRTCREKLLWGITASELQLNDYRQIFLNLSAMETDSTYCISQKTSAEDFFFQSAAQYLALMYRTGIATGAEPDVNRAYSVLAKVEPLLEHEIARREMKKCISHYHKKLLGGYEYIR